MTRKAPWKEPGEAASSASVSGESEGERLYSRHQDRDQHRDQQYPYPYQQRQEGGFAVPSALESEPELVQMEQVAVRMERLGRQGVYKGVAI